MYIFCITATNCVPPQVVVVGNPQAAVSNPPHPSVPAPAAAVAAPPAEENNNDDFDLQPVPPAIPAAVPGPSG